MPIRVIFDGTVSNKKAPQKRGLVMLGGSGEIDFAETTFSNSRLTDCQSTFTCNYGCHKGSFLVSSLL